ncbi:GNAT family N-acetyltransferase [Rhodoblastus acidophilus]|uniref:GNAT family N-acetyltransferase n=1 Tax=Candidatus Rhodoblastus alkanivorans TaxID=2954117 RepID=A0ABS9Z251_9HYPH|nr:GNAT family N-acetyltransferase [Candidatus Rhodoblastus alkanivorans]MCI4678113.1 GNAT family N-acetyltransferase [Candidatus Rhodoblastus alkanivorans]MCI4681546.1 GNAT family N-acetyltransferase [Candidatus Rhodoblastus alkanivorans]MDI4642594.1 GNAT family N-acetyltransferase [Rhodoblastus acidophilus]
MASQADRSDAISPLLIENVDFDQLRRHEAEWRDLAARGLERNVFLEPGFALPFLQHLRRPKNLRFLLAWRKSAAGASGRLMALWPIVAPGAPGAPYETWRHDYSCLGAPLLDRANAASCLNAIVGHLRAEGGHAPILALRQLRRRGPLYSLIADYAGRQGLAVEYAAEYQRAALDATAAEGEAAWPIPAKKRKELRRQLRRLDESGSVSFGVADGGEAFNRQLELFLALEAKGWKGRHGGAFLARPELAAFARTMTRTLAREGKCRIYWLACGERIVASNILLLDADQTFFWKTAYDEDFATLSPGVLLAMQMTDALLRDPRLRRVDSCAIPNHPMIDHIWREREPFADILISCCPGGELALRRAAVRERFRRWLRDRAKSLRTKAQKIIGSRNQRR